jgi:succinate dehydrogenase / fumarate reductase cytochrome b subunit
MVVFYVLAMLFLALHLRHAVWSMFQTLGWANAKIRPLLKQFALGYALIIFFGFISVPLAVYFGLLPAIFFRGVSASAICGLSRLSKVTLS